jgi:hypothetical protein
MVVGPPVTMAAHCCLVIMAPPYDRPPATECALVPDRLRARRAGPPDAAQIRPGRSAALSPRRARDDKPAG